MPRQGPHGHLEESSDFTSPLVRQLRRGRTVKDYLAGETVYVITSLPPDLADAQKLAELVRGYWGIENMLHGVTGSTY